MSQKGWKLNGKGRYYKDWVSYRCYIKPKKDSFFVKCHEYPPLSGPRDVRKLGKAIGTHTAESMLKAREAAQYFVTGHEMKLARRRRK
jgi:hypothetical protein